MQLTVTGSTQHKAFTLIELLVVISIIALLISLLLPALGSAKELARTTQCSAHQKAMGAAFALYAHESKDWFPPERTYDTNNMSPNEGYDLNTFTWPQMFRKAGYIRDGLVYTSRDCQGIFRCPTMLGQQIFASYSTNIGMNSALTTTVTVLPGGAPKVNVNWAGTWKRHGDLKKPSRTYLTADTIISTGGWSSWSFVGNYVDPHPANVHAHDNVVMGFADMHVVPIVTWIGNPPTSNWATLIEWRGY